MAKGKEENAKCILCGKPYHLCIICDSTKPGWKSWKIITDTENCYDIYNVLNDYSFGKITKEEACELLKTLDLSELDNFKDNTKNKLKEILNETTKTVVENESIEDKSVVDEVLEIESQGFVNNKFSKKDKKAN